MILVLGTGRSGTSDVGRILHEQGVNMGNELGKPTEVNPFGDFEDLKFRSLHALWYSLFLDRLNGEGIDDSVPRKIWHKRWSAEVALRSEPWGLKDPELADFPKLLNEYLVFNPKIIYCTRNKNDTIRSFVKTYGFQFEIALYFYQTRKRNIESFIQGRKYLEIDCYALNKKELIKDFLRKK